MVQEELNLSPFKVSDGQEKIVYEIVCQYPAGIRTEKVKIEAMYKGISCADRYLRWLSEKGFLISEKKPKDKTKTWRKNGN